MQLHLPKDFDRCNFYAVVSVIYYTDNGNKTLVELLGERHVEALDKLISQSGVIESSGSIMYILRNTCLKLNYNKDI